MMDRFGEIPRPVENLLRIAALKGIAHSAFVTEVGINRQEVRLTMYPKARMDAAGIPPLVASYKGRLKFQMGDEPCILYQETNKKNQDSSAMMEKAKEILEGLKALVQ